jgi:hypothetical protein
MQEKCGTTLRTINSVAAHEAVTLAYTHLIARSVRQHTQVKQWRTFDVTALPITLEIGALSISSRNGWS